MPAQQDFDDDAWDDLLNYIEERRVIPIIGPDLLRVQTDRGLRALYERLGREQAGRGSRPAAGARSTSGWPRNGPGGCRSTPPACPSPCASTTSCAATSGSAA